MEKLSPEVFAMVCHLIDRDSLKNMSLVSSYLNRLSIPYLHKEFCARIFFIPYQTDSQEANSATGGHQIEPKIYPFSSVRILSISSPRFSANERIPRWLKDKTYVFEDEDSIYEVSDFSEDDDVLFDRNFRVGIASKVSHLLLHLEGNSLQSFNWNVGSGVPESLLGIGGYLPTLQKKIQALSLITYGSPFELPFEENTSTEGIRMFKSVQKFVWKGLRSREEFKSLRSFLRYNSKHLRHLELHMGNCGIRTTDNFDDEFGIPSVKSFVDRIQLRNKTSQLSFPDLRILSLRHTEYIASNEIITMFPFDKLLKLTMIDCLFECRLLKMVSDQYSNIRLKYLELVIYRKHAPSLHELPVFLKRFCGLEHLYLCIFDSIKDEIKRMWQAILHHSSSLQRLLYQEDSTDDLHSASVVTRVPHISLYSSDRPLRFPCIESLGVHEPIQCLPNILTNIFSQPALELLHIRSQDNPYHDLRYAYNPSSILYIRRAEELQKFAEWAFGNTGLPNLQVIAYGDFSPSMSHSNSILLRRVEPSEQAGSDEFGRPIKFENMEKGKNKHFWDIYEAHRDLLEACPWTHPVIHWRPRPFSHISYNFSYISYS